MDGRQQRTERSYFECGGLAAQLFLQLILLGEQRVAELRELVVLIHGHELLRRAVSSDVLPAFGRTVVVVVSVSVPHISSHILAPWWPTTGTVGRRLILRVIVLPPDVVLLSTRLPAVHPPLGHTGLLLLHGMGTTALGLHALVVQSGGAVILEIVCVATVIVCSRGLSQLDHRRDRSQRLLADRTSPPTGTSLFVVAAVCHLPPWSVPAHNSSLTASASSIAASLVAAASAFFPPIVRPDPYYSTRSTVPILI